MKYRDDYQSPIGRLEMVIEDDHLIRLGTEIHEAIEKKTTTFSQRIKDALDGYFHEGKQSIDVPIRLEGTPFQMQMYEALKTVPYGKTISYQQLATMMGMPKATRAVGGALNRNPVMICMPCHRIIGKNGKLTGFAGGLDVKAYLLNLEQQNML